MGEVQGALAVTAQSRSLLGNVRSALSGNSIYALSQFGMLSVLALLTDPTEVGRYALALAITAPAFLFASLKLRQVQVTDANNDYSFGDYLGQRLITSAVTVAVLIPVVAALGMDPRTLATVVAVTVFKAVESVIDILYGAMQRREQLHLVARSQMWRGAGGFAVFAGAIWWAGKVEVASAALAVFTLGQVATNFWRVRRLAVRVAPSFSWITFRRLTGLAFPLGAALAVSSLSVNIPRYVIQATQGTGELGIFAALAYFTTVTGMVVSSLGEAASPRLATLYFAGEFKQFRVTLKKLIAMGAGVGVAGLVGVLVLGGPILGIVFGAEYAARNDVLVVLMAGSAILYSTMFVGTAVNAMRRFTVQLPINAGILVTTAVVAWMTVPTWGIMGGAIAMAAGEIVALVFYVGLFFDVIRPETSAVARRAPKISKGLDYTPRHLAPTRRAVRIQHPLNKAHRGAVD